MSFIHSLCSSSKGNSTYIGDKKSGILVDTGIGIRNFASALALNDIDITAVKGIFITHEHTDHVKGLTAILKKINVPVYATRKTLEQLIVKNIVCASNDLNEICKRPVNICDMQISSFATPHDSVHSQGYAIQTPDDKKVCICTDLGEVTDTVYDNLSGSDFVLLESNYDENMLTFGDYPYFLKQRISSNNGHLSNELCSKTLTKLIKNGTTNFMLGHLSEKNNLPQIALEVAIRELLQANAKFDIDYKLCVAPVKSVGKVIEV